MTTGIDVWSAQALVCVLIGAGANVLKTLAAKLLATSFHRQAHFDKMQDALSKVRDKKDITLCAT